MATTVSIYKLLGSTVRSRMFINTIQQAMKGDEYAVLDFTNIHFISRSFADELYSFITEHKNVHLVGMNEEVQGMYDVVSDSRKNPRKRPVFANNIIDLKTIQELRAFMSTI